VSLASLGCLRYFIRRVLACVFSADTIYVMVELMLVCLSDAVVVCRECRLSVTDVLQLNGAGYGLGCY